MASQVIQNLTSLLGESNEKVKRLEDKCYELETRKDQWKNEFEKYNRIGTVATKYLLCKGCLDQDTHEGQTVEICQTCTKKLQTLRNARAEMEQRDQKVKKLQADVEHWKDQMQEESERADHWYTCCNNERTKYLTLVEKIQCEGCKLNKYNYDKYCSECIKGVEESKTEIKYWRDGYEHLLEKYFQTPRDIVDNGPRDDDGETGGV